MQSAAVVSSKGQVTLPAAMRAKLGIGPGFQIRFELRGKTPLGLTFLPSPLNSAIKFWCR